MAMAVASDGHCQATVVVIEHMVCQLSHMLGVIAWKVKFVKGAFFLHHYHPLQAIGHRTGP